jgi:hypothetical protein
MRIAAGESFAQQHVGNIRVSPDPISRTSPSSNDDLAESPALSGRCDDLSHRLAVTASLAPPGDCAPHSST